MFHENEHSSIIIIIPVFIQLCAQVTTDHTEILDVGAQLGRVGESRPERV